MTSAGYLTVGALAAAIAAFAAGRWRPDAVAVLALLALILFRVLDPRAAFAGFGSPVLVAVGAVFVVSAALERTGVASALGRRLVRLAGASEVLLILSLGGVAGLLSGVMNSIGAMAVLLPAAMAAAREAGVSPSRLLLPLALGTRLGGNLTLIAGPSNLIASRILADHGLRPLGFFELLPIGGPFLLAGLAFIALIGRRWLPSAAPAEYRRRRKWSELYRLGERLFEICVAPNSPLAGRTLEEAALGSAWGVTVLSITRHRRRVVAPSPQDRVLPGDLLLVQGRLDDLLRSGRLSRDDVRERDSVEVDGLESPEVRVVEVILAPRSSLVGKTLREVDFREKYGVNVLAIWREGRPRRTGLVDLPVQLGDALLVQGRRDRLRLLGNDPDFLVLEPEETLPPRPARAPWAVGALLLMILLGTAGVEIAVAALTAAVVVVAGCLSAEEVYQFVDWRSLVFIGAMLPFSTALTATGAADQIVRGVLAAVGGGTLPALVVLLAVGIVANQVMPSVAATVLLAPVAVQIASTTGGNPHAFVMAVIAATGTTFTPISNPVNLLVMGPGGYRLADYVRLGLPLALLLGGLSLLLIPLLWPLR
ncbi:MAG: SLC13 family permease [Armatimonadota bacterium]|nr:SLC13 family permease [Armatimonadota bacterium]MDR7558256.1 SLC13 family permease [Armatimonadota bacterium]